METTYTEEDLELIKDAMEVHAFSEWEIQRMMHELNGEEFSYFSVSSHSFEELEQIAEDIDVFEIVDEGRELYSDGN